MHTSAAGCSNRGREKSAIDAIAAGLYLSVGTTLPDNYFLSRVTRVSLGKLLRATMISNAIQQAGLGDISRTIPAPILDSSFGPVDGEVYCPGSTL